MDVVWGMEGEALQRWRVRFCSAWGDLISSVMGAMWGWGRGKPSFLSRIGFGALGLGAWAGVGGEGQGCG